MYWPENTMCKCEIDTLVISWPFYNSIKKLWEIGWKMGITHYPDNLKTIFNLHNYFLASVCVFLCSCNYSCESLFPAFLYLINTIIKPSLLLKVA